LSIDSEPKEPGVSAVAASRHDTVVIVRMTREENRLHPELLDGLHRALDDVEKSEQPTALVLTGEGRFFSNGLDLDFLGSAGTDEVTANLVQLHRLYARLLGSGVFSVAAINGHAFAGGAMLSLACDARVMRADRGYFCLPEVDLGMPFTPGMQALITSRLSPAVAQEAMVTGRRFGGAEAAQRGIVDAAVAEDEVLTEAVRLAGAMAGKARAGVATIKRSLYAAAIAACEGYGAG
jgi:enoyl-CoA hydratase/carnithine racemase